MLVVQLMTLSLPVGAEEIHVALGESIQSAINVAVPGDTIIVAAGTYEADLSTESQGEPDAPITMKGVEDGEVIITADGEVLQVDHPHWRFEDLIFDGQYGSSDTVDINDEANFLVLSNVEIRHSGRDCVDMASPSYVQIENSLIHHCLQYDDDDEVRRDAHGITGGAVQNLNIINTDIHTFSGDGIQFDPSRTAPGWNNIGIQGCRIWLEPLAEATNGFPAGVIPGENAIDTKTPSGGERASLTVEDTEVWGFKDGVDFSNQAAFLFKENVDVKVSRTHIHDSEIALRVRGPTTSRPDGAHVTIENSIIHDVDIGVRYEDNIDALSLLHVTVGVGVETALEAADTEATTPTIRSSLFMGDTLPEAASSGSNGIATHSDFVDAAGGDYHLTASASAIDAGEEIAGIDTDFDGASRVEGSAPDQGAFEFGHTPIEDTGDTGGGTVDTGDTDTPPTDTGLTSDTGLDGEDSPSGVGAAEAVGEKGGCGCSQTHQTHTRFWPFLFLVSILLSIRRRSG